MADEPQATPESSVEAQPAEPVTMASLDAAMASARARADAQQADQETTDTADAQERQTERSGERSDATSERPAESEEDAALEEDEPGSTEQQVTDQPPKPTRMGRLREQLTQAEQRTRDAEAKLQERLGLDLKVTQKYQALLGTAEEKQRLVNAIANPSTPVYELNQARSRLAQMNQAQEELAPVYKAIEADVFAHFSRGMETLRTLDGMTEESHAALFKAASGVEALKLMHGIGQKAAEEAYKGEIASRDATIKDLKRKLAAAGTHPAGGGGLAAGGSSGLAGLLDEHGLPTEEAIRAAKNGHYRQLQSA